MMRIARRGFMTSARLLAEEATGKAAELRVTLAVPAAPILSRAECVRVTLPGRGGTYGVEKNSPALLSELRPGVVRVDFADGKKQEFFVPGGFAITSKDNVVDVSTPEARSLDDFDVDRLRHENAAWVSKRDTAAAGSKEHAEANIVLEVYKELAKALNATL